MRVMLLGIILLGSWLTVFAGSQDFISDAHFAESVQASMGSALNKAHVTANSLPGYRANPAASRYKNNPQAMQSAALAALKPGSAGEAVVDEVRSGKQITLNPNTQGMQKSQAVMDDANAIVHGHDGHAIACVQPGQCHITIVHKTCQTSSATAFNCTVSAKLSVTTQTQNDKQLLSLSHGDVTPFNFPVGSVVTSAVLDGKTTSPFDRSYTLHVNQKMYRGSVQDRDHQGGYYWPFSKAIPADWFDAKTHNTAQLTPAAWVGNITLYYQVTTKTPHVNWVSSCTQLPAQCQRIERVCQVPGGSRILEGVKFTEPCWAYQDSYQCGTGKASTSCQVLRQQGCQLIARTCTEKAGGLCLNSEDTYSCSQQNCTGKTNICAGNVFCVDGQCYEKKPTQETASDFAKAGSELAAAGEAAHDASTPGRTPNAIFAGQDMRCSNDALGLSNCCRMHGWGQDIHLMHCSADEKRLGQLREKDYAFGLGDYCSHRVLGVCLQHKQTFCVFNGVLAKDVQVQGRYQQLGVSFGNAKNPRCRGLTPAELSRIDFDKIDFSNFYKSIQNNTKLPNASDLQKRIEQDIKGKV